MVVALLFVYLLGGICVSSMLYDELKLKNPLYKLPITLVWPIPFALCIVYAVFYALFAIIKDWFIEVVDYYKDKKSDKEK